ncbi:MAG: hypothetical protein K9L60_02610 [Methylovulum sp.]|jgi:tetratricopeptide (TPR) repeat protein|nr:hypothetical protein [Methylovulum sp.]MCF7998071.1 hypothetical protein [Methylovulum sp.]
MIFRRLLFITLLLFVQNAIADLHHVLLGFESEWAIIYYGTPKKQQGASYEKLLEKISHVLEQNPNNADVMFWKAVVGGSYANHQTPVAALNAIYEVRDLLNNVIAINPNTMSGSAYVVLGTLYYKAPPWPVAFGDNKIASNLLQTALKINPNGIDSNYFYAAFLSTEHQFEEAQRYFAKAIAAPIRPEQRYSDTQLQNAAKRELERLAKL